MNEEIILKTCEKYGDYFESAIYEDMATGYNKVFNEVLPKMGIHFKAYKADELNDDFNTMCYVDTNIGSVVIDWFVPTGFANYSHMARVLLSYYEKAFDLLDLLHSKGLENVREEN